MEVNLIQACSVDARCLLAGIDSAVAADAASIMPKIHGSRCEIDQALRIIRKSLKEVKSA